MSKKKNHINKNKHSNMQPNSIDPIMYERLKMARKYFQDGRKQQRLEKDTSLRDGFDLDQHRGERRIEATVNATDDMLDILKAAGLEPQEWAESAWLKSNLLPLIGSDSLDEEQHITLAIAIWILDRLMENGRFQDAVAFFPQESELDVTAKIPPVQDLIHSDFAIRSMLWIIRHRNDDCIGLRKIDRSKIPRYYMDEYTTHRMHHQDVPSRHRFDSILSMIPHHEIDKAVALYQELHNDLILRFYRSQVVLAEKEDQLQSMGTDNAEDMYDLVDEGLSQEKQAWSGASSLHTNLMSLRAENLYVREYMRREALSQLGSQCFNLYEAIGFFHTYDHSQRQKLFSDEVSAVWNDLAIHYPYDLCFAFLYLLDHDSPLPWLSAISTTLMKFCAAALPWYDSPVFYQIGTPTGAEYKPTDNDTKNTSHHGTFFPDSFETNTDVSKNLNISQIVYQMTGYLIPRRCYLTSQDMNFLCRFGLEKTAFQDILLHLLMPINAIKYHTYVSPVPEEAVQEEEINTDELREKIRQLEAEKKQLRMQLYDANRRSQNALDELSKIRSATEKDRCELAELRTLVFREQHEEQSEVPDDTISFPYYTNKKVIIVGGSDSWRNEMSKRLPDVSFVKPDTMPDPRLMRNADEIWFQTHYMSHDLYDTVKSQVSGYPIKINYFLAKGVAKCAEELVKYHCA